MSKFLRYGTLTYDEFVARPTIFCNRDVEPRQKKIGKIARNNPAPTFYEVIVFIYQDGHEELADGNSRRAWWQNDKNRSYRPTSVRVKYYEVKDEEDAKNLYYSIDSQSAYETGNEKLTGAFRALDIKLQTPKYKKGQLISALTIACRKNLHMKSKIGDWFTIAEYFKDEIIHLDNFRPKSFNTTYDAGSIMMLKRYGTEDDRLNTAIFNLAHGTRGGGDPKNGYDPITLIWEEWHTHRVLGEKGNASPQFERQLDFFLWHMEKFRANQKVKSFKSPGRREDLFSTWWDYQYKLVAKTA